MKIIYIVLGFIMLGLWFTPWQTVEFMGVQGTRSGEHMGGITYLLLLTGLGYAIAGWFEQKALLLIMSVIGLLISLFVLFNLSGVDAFNSGLGWGLIAMIAAYIAGCVLAFVCKTSQKTISS